MLPNERETPQRPAPKRRKVENNISDISMLHDEIHIDNKAYECTSLLHPGNEIKSLSAEIKACVDEYLKQYLLESVYDVKFRLIQMINIPANCSLCKECQSVFVNKSINVHINCFLKTMNDVIKSISKKRNVKAKKIMHE